MYIENYIGFCKLVWRGGLFLDVDVYLSLVKFVVDEGLIVLKFVFKVLVEYLEKV